MMPAAHERSLWERLRRSALIFSFALVALSVLGPRPALSGQPAPTWRTLETPHFVLHFPAGLDALAARAARICEEAHAVLTPVLAHAPRQRTQVVLSDFGDAANGSATALPSLQMRLNAATPALDGNLNDYDDWMRVLIYHEYTHILHLDTMSGLPALLNNVFGRSFAPNQNMPSVLIEGAAVWLESRTSGRGRVRSAWFRGWLRAAALDGTLAPLDVALHAPLDWPGPNVWYMYGGHFVDWLTRTHGEAGIARLFAAYGDDVLPFAVNGAFIEAFGRPLSTAWAAWQSDLTRSATMERDRLLAEGQPTPWVRLTTAGHRHEDARFMPDGRLIALEIGPDDLPALWARSPADGFAARTHMLDINGTDHFDVCDDGSLVLDRVDRFDGQFSGYDLVALRDGRLIRVTRGLRVREPACGPGARFYVAVQLVEGRTRLVRVDAETGALTVLVDPGGAGQLAFPAVSPDGTQVVATEITSGHRGLTLVDLASGARRALTNDNALSLHARFTPDGRSVVYASDRSGVLDLYRVDLEPGSMPHRLTRTVTGVTGPALSLDGQTLVASMLVARGEDLVRVPTSALLNAPATPPLPVPAARPEVSDVPLPMRPYSPLDTLAPVAWSPLFAFGRPDDATSQLGVLVEAADVVGEHVIIGDIATLPTEEDWRGQVAYAYRGLAPTFSATAARSARTRADAAYAAGARKDWRERTGTTAASVSLPLGRAGHSAAVSARWTYERTTPDGNPPLQFDPLDRSPSAPRATEGAHLAVGLSWSSREQSLFSPSVQAGGSANLTLRVRDPALLSDASTAEVLWDATRGVSLWAGHALALRLSGALGQGDTDRSITYALSAAPERNLLLDTLDQIYFGSTVLRGFPSGTVAGSRYLLGSAEYRLPLWSLWRGLGTAPVFGRRLNLALFTDWAQGRRDAYRLVPAAFRKTVGVELAASALLGWRLPMDARLGLAQGFGADGELQTYFFLGPWF